METDRLRLRRFVSEDADDLFRLYSDPDATRFLGGPHTRKQVEDEIAWCLDQYGRNVTTGGCGPAFWATVLKADGAFVGRCGLLPQLVEGLPEAEVAYMVERERWGQGLGLEAARGIKAWGFRHYEFPRLVSLIDPANLRSIRVAEKNGMFPERAVDFEGGRVILYSVARPSH